MGGHRDKPSRVPRRGTAPRPRLSTEQKKFNRTHRCPHCSMRMLNPAYTMPDGTPVSPRTMRGILQGALVGGLLTLPAMGLGAIPGGVVGGLRGSFKGMQATATCSHCGQGWNVFAPLETSAPASSGDLVVHQIVETLRTEELIGDELRKIDNSGTSTSSARRLRAMRRWAKTCDIQLERATSATRGSDVAVQGLAGYHSAVEDAVKRNYAVTAEEEQTFEEEIELTVPPRTSVQLCLHWKRLWQEGYVLMKALDGETVSIPFRTVIGVTFDQESIDA
jgi:transcription elongation factor Elf1